MDLSDWKQVKFLSSLLFKAQINLKVINLSHLWLDKYTGSKKLLAFQAQIRPVITHDTIVVLSESHRGGIWSYLGMRFDWFANFLNEAVTGEKDIFRKYFLEMKAKRLNVSFLDFDTRKIEIGSCKQVLSTLKRQ